MAKCLTDEGKSDDRREGNKGGAANKNTRWINQSAGEKRWQERHGDI